MAKDTQSRKWLLTINNPAEHGFTHDIIKEKVEKLNLRYFAMCDETGENGTYHTHIFLYRESQMRFSTIKNLFPEAHIDKAKGTCKQNRDYIRKEGKWEEDKKKETNHIETFEEIGVCPIEEQGARNDIKHLYEMVKSGMDNFEILEANPNYMLRLDKVDKVRQTLKEQEFRNKFRELETTYIFGTTGAGKTRGVMEKYGYSNVYRITSYDRNPWDGYEGQDVVVFEEFRSSFKIQDMLNYLDGYPLALPCRYNNKVACFTKAYIITNIPLEEQFESVQKEYPETWKAFLRRIHKIKEYSPSGTREYNVEEYLHRYDWVQEAAHAPEITPLIS